MTEPLAPNNYLKLQVSLPRLGVFVLDDPNHGRLDSDLLGGDTVMNNLFVLDRSRLDDQLLSTAGEDPNSVWTDVLSYVQSMSIQRGADETETGSVLQPGIFTVTLIGPELDPHQNLAIVPGVSVRLLTKDNVPVFTGKIKRVTTAYGMDDYVKVTLSVQDGVQALGSIMRYGADDASFGLRIDDLLAKHSIPYERVGGTVMLAQTDYEAKLIDHLQLAVNSENGWFYVDRDGVTKIGGAGTGYDPYTREIRTNLHKNPGFRTSANYASTASHSNYDWLAGAGRGGRGAIGMTFTSAYAAYNTTFMAVNTQAWSNTPADAIAVTPGKTYTVSSYMKTNKSNQPLASWIGWTNQAGQVTTYSDYGATAFSTGDWVRTSVTATAPVGAVGMVYYFGARWDTGTSWAAGQYINGCDVLIEQSSTLGDFLDGGFTDTDTVFYKWTDSENASTSVRTYAVAKADTMSFDLSDYKDIDYSYDSTAILNRLQVDNRTWGVNDQGEEEGQTVTTVYTDATSEATWGASSATLETNLANQADVDRLAGLLLQQNRAPVNTVKSLTFNATDCMESAAQIDPYQVIRVRFENRYFEEVDFYRILSVQHSITRDKWMVTLTLQHYEGGL